VGLYQLWGSQEGSGAPAGIGGGAGCDRGSGGESDGSLGPGGEHPGGDAGSDGSDGHE
jgi:hypothetical protein